MAPISIKIIMDDGAVTRKVKFDSTLSVAKAHEIVKEKFNLPADSKDYGLFLRSADNDVSGVWLDYNRNLDYYMLRDGDTLDYLPKERLLKVKILDGTVKTLKLDQSKQIGELMRVICGRIGITNHDEYGLCWMEDEKVENKPRSTGTLTAKTLQSGRDAQFEELSKKLHTDDNVKWLDHHKTLRELSLDETTPFLLKRKLFYSDKNVDERDPMQLNLLYLQTRDAILNLTHPVTEKEAIEFAGIQCQIHYGDYQEDRFKPGFISNMNEYLPSQYSGSWGVEKKIIKAYKKHQGLTPLHAKSLYIKTARDLPTFGVTFFLVKEKMKGKKKLIPRLLGINAESILRLDETTKEILQVWPLTHVKTYNVANAEAFILNFGEYSEEPYTVKTRDANQIRDILEGYIDLIGKKLLAKHNFSSSDRMIITEDEVAPSKLNTIQYIANNPNKIVEHSFVGPSKIISYENASECRQGTQIMTVQKILTMGQLQQQQHAVVGELPQRGDMSMDCIRKLNRLNSNSVKMVTFLTDPTDDNIRQAQDILRTINEDKPIIVDGLRKAAENQSNPEMTKKMLEDLQELEELLRSLNECMEPNKYKLSEADEAACRIADLSTQIYFSMDPRTRRRSDLLNRSRKSFIADEKMDKTLRRASFIAAATTTLHALNAAQNDIAKECGDLELTPVQQAQLQESTSENVRKLSAAVALYLMAHADPQMVDYQAAINSLNMIRELVPEIAKDSLAWKSMKDNEAAEGVVKDINSLCSMTSKLCTFTGPDDHEKMQEACNGYADVSRKLLCALGRGGNMDKEVEIIDLSKNVGDKSSNLLDAVDKLLGEVPDDDSSASKEVADAKSRVAYCARDLLACAQLTAPSLHEPHCRSALMAASEALSSSVQHLALVWKPLVEDPSRNHNREALKHNSLLIARALDALKNAVGSLGDSESSDIGDDQKQRELRRLKFINSTAQAKKNLEDARKELNEPVICQLMREEDAARLQSGLADKLAQLNAAIAALISSTSDRDHPDYATADLAVGTISELLPQAVYDAKVLSSNKSPEDCKALLDSIKALCDASRSICESAEQGKSLSEGAVQFAEASEKLACGTDFNFNPDKANRIKDLVSEACASASQLLSKVQQLSETVGGDVGEQLDKEGIKVADATQNLITAAQLTAPLISNARCQSALLSSVDAVSGSSQQLQNCWRQLQHPHVVLLDHDRKLLEDKLDDIRKACQEDPKVPCEQHRLQFIRTLPSAKQNLQTAEDLIYKPVSKRVSSRDVPALEHRLQQSVARHNASVVDLLAATADADNPDYERADAAIRSITETMPEMVEDARALSATGDETSRKALLDRIKALCEATKALCGSVEDPKEFKESAARLSEASQKLKFVFSSNKNPRNQQKEQEIMDLTSSACGAASQLLSKVQQMSVEVGGDAGERLDGAGTRLAETTKNMLTTAQLTAPSISDARCQSALLSSVDAVSGSSQQLQNCWRQLQHPHVVQLNQDCKQLEDHLEHVRRACRIPTDDTTTEKQVSSGREQQRLKFIRTLPSARHNLQAAENLLNEPVNKRVSSGDVPSLEHRLQQSVARHNANVANLLAATADAENPDYERANEAIKNITETMPMIVEDAKALSCTQDGESRKALLERIKALCEATKSLCGYAEDPMELKESTSKLSDASQKLKFVFSSNRDPTSLQKEQKIIDLASSACGTASQMLSKVQQISEEIGGDAGMTLDVAGTRVVDSTKNMLTTAQLTAPSIEEPTCRSALLAAVDGVSNSSQELQDCWKQLRHPQIGVLDYEHKLLEDELEQIRVACQDAELQGPNKIPITEKPKVLQKPSSIKPGIATKPSLKAKPFTDPVMKIGDRSVDKLRENQLKSPVATSHVQSSSVNADQEKLLERLKTTVDEANKKIREVEDKIKQANELGEVKPLLNISSSELSNKKKKIQDNLALASVQVASLVAVNYADKIDYETVQKSIKSLPQLTSDIVQDGILTSNTLKTDARKAFLDDMLNYCEATKQLCDTAKNDRGKINEAAIDFGDKSTKLLYSISCDADPALEKEIISRAKQIGDSASRLAMAAAHFAQDWSDGGVNLQNICDGGANCVDAVGKLVYTSKLVSPTINNKYSQEALITSADVVSEHLKTFSSVWKPLSSDPRQAKDVYQLNEEAQNLEKLLEDLRGDVKDGKIAKAREEEKLVIENSPLRQLSCEILNGALKSSECMELPVSMRQKYKDYAYNLKNALKDLDLANDRYRRAPYDTDRAIDLESAIENLKISLLQTRPKVNDAESSNVVDIRDFLQDLTIEADKLTERATEIHSLTQCDHDNIEKIKENCHEISSKAFELMHEGNQDGEVLEQFGEECNDRIKTLRSVLEKCQDQKTKELEHRLEALEESCKLYWFAAKCNLSTARSAALDATLNDLNDIQRRVIKTLLPANEVQGAVTMCKRPPVPPKPQMKAKLSGAVAAAAKQASNSEHLAAAFTDYIADIASSDYGSNGEKRGLLLAHLYKLVDLMKILSLTVNKRVATWQPVEDPEVSRITEQILREIENPESKFSAAESSTQNQLFSADNAYQMLLPNDKIKITDDKQKLNKKLHQYSSKLSATCTDILQSLSQPSSLPQVLAGAVHSAAQLGDVARAHRTKDPVHNSRIEDAIQDLSFATYNMLKTAEYASRDLDHPVSRRRLLDALRQLNESINTLVRCCSPGPSSEMTRMKRHLQLQTSTSQFQHPTCGLPYLHCVDALNNQKDVLSKLKNEEAMPREELIKDLGYITSAVCNSSEYFQQCAYLMSISEQDLSAAKEGLVDIRKIQKSIGAVRDSCIRLIRTEHIDDIKEDIPKLKNQMKDLTQSLTEAQDKIKDEKLSKDLTQSKTEADSIFDAICWALDKNEETKIAPLTMDLMSVLKNTDNLIENPALTPTPKTLSADTRQRCEEISNSSKVLLSITQDLVDEVSRSPEEPEMMTWVMFGNSKKVLKAFDDLLKTVQINGQRAGIILGSPEDTSEISDSPVKSFLDTQLEIANKWLNKPTCKAATKSAGQKAAKTIIDVAEKMAEDMTPAEKLEWKQMFHETDVLLNDCCQRYDQEKYSIFSHRLKDLKKMIERGVVTRVVEDFMDQEEPLADLDILVDSEKDEKKRQYLLEKKIAELLAQLGRVTRTARFVADTGTGDQALTDQLKQCSNQTELLAPMLVKAAQERLAKPNDQAIIDNYKSMLAQYAESVSKVRDLCDQAVDPMEFVQTAGETMQRLREESALTNDTLKGAQTSYVISKLGGRVISVTMKSSDVRDDPELAAALRVLTAAAAPPRASRLPDWKDATAQILRTTGEVESMLGGEGIFKKQPEPDQPIYSVALDLHTAVRGWSSRDNEIVGVAKRMAVLMAKLSEYMNTDKKRNLLITSKKIVEESHEVAYLAKKLAAECTDVRIKTNLLNACERIPTISAQLKMLTTVKGSSLGRQGTEEDKEAMNMLVGNAQSLMLSIQDVVKAAASASVKIMSQTGPRIKWVRKTYY